MATGTKPAELRTLTDESDEIVLRLQAVLDRTAGLADQLGGGSIEGFEAALNGFFDEAAALGAVIGGIGQDRADAAMVFDAAGQSLPHRLGHAAQALTRFQLLLREMVFFDAAISARRAGLAAGAGPDAAALAAVRQRYTMQSERDVHDRLFGASVLPEAKSVAASDDLDDVLF